MKKAKRLLAVAAALLLMLSMNGFSAFAAENVNLIDPSLIKAGETEGRAGTYEILENGSVKLTATGEKGFGFNEQLDLEFDIAQLPYVQLDISSTGRFNIAFHVETKNGDAWPQLASDWYNVLQEEKPGDGMGVNAADFHGVLNMEGFFTYDNEANMPIDGKSTILTMSVAIYEPGELTLGWMQLSSEETFEGGNVDPSATQPKETEPEPEPTEEAADPAPTDQKADAPAADKPQEAVDAPASGGPIVFVLIGVVAVAAVVAVVVIVIKKKKTQSDL